jgi:hypothetical protein
MSHNPLNEECPLYNFELNGLDVSWHPDCTCVPKQDDHVGDANKMVKEEWESQARNIMLNEQIDGQFIDMFIGYMKGIVGTTLAEARKEERERVVTEFVEEIKKQIAKRTDPKIIEVAIDKCLTAPFRGVAVHHAMHSVRDKALTDLLAFADSLKKK